MKNLLTKVRTFGLCFLFCSTMASHQASAVGVAVGVERNVTEGIFAKTTPDYLFVGADVFANYYDRGTVDWNYGAKATFGYKIHNALVFGLAGVQSTEFNHGASSSFDEHTSPIYGFGIGYNFPSTNLGVRLNQTYYDLEMTNGTNEDFSFTDIMLVLVF